MNSNHHGSILARLFCVFIFLFVAEGAFAADKDEARSKIRAQSSNILTRLYEIRPGAKEAIQKSAGYATFSNFGLKVGTAGTGKGKGLAVVTRTKKETFMRFVEVQAGLGVGVKKYDLVFVFETDDAFKKFIDSGWQHGGQGTLSAKGKHMGKSLEGAVSVSPGVWLYQLTTKGLAAEVTMKSTRYYADKDLN